MATAHFTLSAFGDEIDQDLAAQLDLLESEGVRGLEFRSAWGTNVIDLDDDQRRRAAQLLRERGFSVSAIGSPIGKSQLDQPREYELERLDRAIAAAESFGTRRIRVFSFYVAPEDLDARRDEVIERMRLLARRAEEAGVTLWHENERDIYGERPERCRDLLDSVGSPALQMAFDPANFVQAGVRPMAEGWPLLADLTTHVHIKDARFSDKGVTPAGDGDGEVPALLAALVERGYRGYLTLEPHLAHAGRSGGYSGPEGMRVAIRALRRLLEPYPQTLEG